MLPSRNSPTHGASRSTASIGGGALHRSISRASASRSTRAIISRAVAHCSVVLALGLGVAATEEAVGQGQHPTRGLLVGQPWISEPGLPQSADSPRATPLI